MSTDYYKKELEKQGEPTIKVHLDNLQNVAERLAGCIKARETGLMSWWEMTMDLMREMKANLDHAGIK